MRCHLGSSAVRGDGRAAHAESFAGKRLALSSSLDGDLNRRKPMRNPERHKG